MSMKDNESLTRVEKHLIRPSSPCFSLIGDFCHRAKNLYNHANYIVRSRFIKDGYWTRYKELDQILKHDLEYPDYRAMPTAQSAQQVLRLLDKNWKSFFAAINDWKQHKEKYLGRPKLPKYKSRFFMGWHKDEKILLNSSSGGAFTAIADLILEQGGIVFGAWFDDINHTVQHIGIEKSNELWKLRLSKYFQGRIYDCYTLAESELKTGRQVLFTGTGCQIAGLYKYLGKEYGNLLTVDILCHGITSKKIIDAYIKSKEKRYKRKIKTFRFRLKPSDSDWMQGGGN